MFAVELLDELGPRVLRGSPKLHLDEDALLAHRRGKGGAIQVKGNGFVAAAFRHRVTVTLQRASETFAQLEAGELDRTATLKRIGELLHDSSENVRKTHSHYFSADEDVLASVEKNLLVIAGR